MVEMHTRIVTELQDGYYIVDRMSLHGGPLGSAKKGLLVRRKEMTNWKQFLTENVLHEVWHELKKTENSNCSCGQPYHLRRPCDHCNRTFNNRNDLIDLYERLKRDEKWDDFLVFLWPEYLDASKHLLNTNLKTSRGAFIAWLFCLGDDDYESRCKMVVEFYGWKEKK
jgi:hypothetical protein